MSRSRVLVVEDDPAVRRGLVDSLQFAGYEVLECTEGHGARATLAGAELDLVLLDVVLPGGRGAEEDRVRGLRRGADDYVVKPFSSTELLARVEAVLRRSAERPLDVALLTLGPTQVHLERREVERDGQRDTLSEKEVQILRYLASAPDRAVSRAELLQRVWGLDPRGLDTRTVDMHVARLRDKLGEEAAQARWIVTVRGKGYMLGTEVEVGTR